MISIIICQLRAVFVKRFFLDRIFLGFFISYFANGNQDIVIQYKILKLSSLILASSFWYIMAIMYWNMFARHRAYSWLFSEGENELRATFDSHTFPEHFAESKEIMGLAPAAVVLSRRESCESPLKPLDACRRPRSSTPIIGQYTLSNTPLVHRLNGTLANPTSFNCLHLLEHVSVQYSEKTLTLQWTRFFFPFRIYSHPILYNPYYQTCLLLPSITCGSCKETEAIEGKSRSNHGD